MKKLTRFGVLHSRTSSCFEHNTRLALMWHLFGCFIYIHMSGSELILCDKTFCYDNNEKRKQQGVEMSTILNVFEF